MGSEIGNVARKYRRALRNETGVHFTLDELRAFAERGALDIATQAENEELTKCNARPSLTPLATTGSPSAGTVSRRTSGSLPPIPRGQDRSFIEALGLGS
jgi:hypothetical protein